MKITVKFRIIISECVICRVIRNGERAAIQPFLLACGQTIKKLQEKGVDVQLLSHTGVASSAVEQITLRLKEDWVYIKV